MQPQILDHLSRNQKGPQVFSLNRNWAGKGNDNATYRTFCFRWCWKGVVATKSCCGEVLPSLLEWKCGNSEHSDCADSLMVCFMRHLGFNFLHLGLTCPNSNKDWYFRMEGPFLRALNFWCHIFTKVSLLLMNPSWLTYVFHLFHPVGQEIREKFSGAVEVFSRRHASSSGRHGDHSKHRTTEDVPSSKDVVLFILQ